jgi:hypothetical protein
MVALFRRLDECKRYVPECSVPIAKRRKQVTVSSRTPEGLPGHCVLCGKDFQIEYSDPGNDATCPYCGHLTTLSAELLGNFK